MRSFNTAGPVKSDKHYCIPPLSRVDLDEVLRMARCAAEAGHLVVIDCREHRTWEEKVFHHRRGAAAAPVDVWGM